MFLLTVSVFILCFIFGSIRTAVIKSQFETQKFPASFEMKVTSIKIKDSTKIILGYITKINLTQKTVQKISGPDFKIKDKVVVYSHTTENINPDELLNVDGVIQNELIILPKKDEKINYIKSFDLMEYWSARNINYISMYPKVTKVESQETVLYSVSYYAHTFRQSFYKNLENVMENKNAGLVMAMLWGDESHISTQTNNGYRAAGISHILVLSGYNLVIVAVLATFIFQKLKLKTRIVSAFIFLLIFILLAETASPVWRAAIMVSYAMLGSYFNRQADSRLAIWATAFLFGLYSPTVFMQDVSFHMSFLATLSIIYFYPLITNVFEYFFKIENYSKPFKAFISVSVLTISANILISPYILYQFSFFKVSGIVLSIFISAFVPIIMLFGFLSGVVAYFSLVTSKILAFLVDVLLNITNALVHFVSEAGYSFNINLSFTGLILSYLALSIVFIFGEFYFKVSDQAHKKINSKN